MNKRYLSLISDPPPGFATGTIGKRELLSSAVVLLAENCDSAYALLPDFKTRVEGIVLTPGPPEITRVGPLLWHVSLPLVSLTQNQILLQAVLDAVTVAGEERDQATVARVAKERLYAENEVHRQDYQRITAALQIQVALVTDSEDKLTTILDSVDSFIYLKDKESRYLFANRPLRELWSIDKDDLMGSRDEHYFDATTATSIRLKDRKVLESGEILKTEEVMTVPGTGKTAFYISTRLPLRHEDGTIYALCGILTDITERKLMEEQVRQMAFYDPLTELPNRRLLYDRLSQTMASSKRSGCHSALMFIDLDNFKPLNDAHGHEFGDLLLIEVARRLKACVRSMDTVARFGGDEFVVMIPEMDADKRKTAMQAGIIAEKCRAALSETYRLVLAPGSGSESRVEHTCTACIGVTLFLHSSSSQDEILKQADAAMYEAKDAGRNSIRFHDSDKPVK